jgi:hypothetical protein
VGRLVVAHDNWGGLDITWSNALSFIKDVCISCFSRAFLIISIKDSICKNQVEKNVNTKQKTRQKKFSDFLPQKPMKQNRLSTEPNTLV